MKSYRPWSPTQAFLLPPSPMEWLPEGHVAFDGTKVKASASKHKAMSHQRMQEEEKRLQAEVKALLARADAADAQEDGRYGPGQDAEDLPAELQRRESRLARILEAKAALEQEAREARAETLREQARGNRERAADEAVDPAERQRAATRAAKAEAQARAHDDKDDDGPGDSAGGDLPRHRVPAKPDGTPKPGAQRNFTDPDSRIMVKGGEFLQGYNAQAAVDAECQIIVAAAVTNQAPDQQHLVPMLDRVIANCGQAPAVASADTGCFSRENAEALQARGVDAYLAVGRDPAAVPAGQPPSLAQRAREAMAAKLVTNAGKATYARRKAIVEPVFGLIKQARGFRSFSLRSLAKVRAEWDFVCATHNLLKLFRYGPWSLGALPQG